MNTTAAAAPIALSNDLLTGLEWNPAQVRSFLHLAADVKAHPDRYRGALAGRFFALIFEKPSLRTDRKSTRLNSSHIQKSRMPSSA